MSKIVAISGGAQGIGRAVALAFAEQGYAVSIMDPHKEAGFELIRLIRQRDGQALFIAGDVANEADVEKWLKLTAEDLGGIDVMVNNAGIGSSGFMLDMPLDAFDRVIRVNLRGTFVCARVAARLMQRKKQGAIINIASTRAFMSEPDTEAYAASKGGILSLTHAMAVSLGHFGIRVNAISPGWIDTAPWQYTPHAARPTHTQQDHLQHPVGRIGKPEDIAQACLFLANAQQSGFMTGQNLVIDGGMTIKMIYE